MHLPIRSTRARVGLVSVAALIAASLVGATSTPAHAVQAPGHDVATWATGWSWNYATTFKYVGTDGTNATINENLIYTNAGLTTFQGQAAYQINLSGNITGGSGAAQVSGVGNATLDSFSGSVSGTEYIRRSDLALLQESQHQNLNAKAHVSILSANVTAAFDITLTPDHGWRTLDFPLNAGDSWQNDLNVDYTGGFSYDAGSYGSGSSPIEGTFPIDAPSNVSAATITAAGGSQATDYVAASGSTPDGTVTDNNWWSPAFKNVAQEHLQLPLDGATLTEDRTLSSASTPAPSTTLSETITPSLSCAGGNVTVSGALSNHAANQPVTVTFDRSAITPGDAQTVSTATDSGGNYSATLVALNLPDGFAHNNGVRGSWGITTNSGSATNGATLVVTQQDCSSLTYGGALAAPTGTSVTASATLTDLAGGSVAGRTVSFALSGGSTVTGVTNGAGLATATLPVAGSPRNATLTVSYAGAGDLAPASTSAGFTVNQDPTSTAVSASSGSVTTGDPVTFTATVTPGVGSGPTGSVQFYVNGSTFGAPVALTGSSATSAPYVTSALGYLDVHAVYLGDTTFATSTSPNIQVRVHVPLLPTTTTLAAVPTTAVAGQDVGLTATVTTSNGGTATGTVTFLDGATPLGTVSLDNGSAVLHTTALGVGNHGIVAQYSGDDTYNGTNSSPSNVSVAKDDVDVTLTSPDTSTVAGETVDLTAGVAAKAPGSGTPTGAVQLLVDGNPTGAPVGLVSGVATFPALGSLTKGDHALAVQYAGDGSFNSGSTSIIQHVAKADTTTAVTASPSPSSEDQAVVIKAHVGAVAPGAGSPTGTVTFTSDGDPIGAGTLQPGATGGSDATLTVTDLAPGSHTIVATYAGDANYGNSVSEGISQTVIAGAARVATTTSVSSSINPATFGQLISFTATVAADDDSTPAGTVQFSVDGVNVGDPVDVEADGTATSVTLAAPEPGDHTVIAAFDGGAAYTSSGDIITQTVADADVAVHVTSSTQHSDYGQAVHFTASVASQQVGTGTPTGFVQFGVDGHPLGAAVALDHGNATSPSVANLAPGTHTVTALYSGDADFNTDSDTLTQSVDQVATTTALTITPASSTYGQSVALHAVVTPATTSFGTPTGTVSFVEGSTTLASVPLTAGAADATLTGLPAGTHSIKAVYSGATLFAGSASVAGAATVAKRATTLTGDAAVLSLVPLGLPLGSLHVKLTSANGPVAGAPITFKVGSVTVCTINTAADGSATCNAASQLLSLVLNNGYTATYAGSANDLASSTKAGIIK